MYQNNKRNNGISQNQGLSFMEDMIKLALEDEKKAIAFYKTMASRFEDEDDAKFVEDIYLDEVRHYRVLENIYSTLFNKNVEPMDFSQIQSKLPNNNFQNFQNTFNDEISAFEFYRDLYFNVNDQNLKKLFFELMSDEQKHAVKINYLLTKYNCFR